MKRYKSMSILGIVLLFSATSFSAQDNEAIRALSLEEIWKIAELNNRQLKLSDLHLQQSHLEALQAQDRLLPELSIGGDLKINSKFLIYDDGLFSSPQSVPIKDYGYSVGYNLSFTLYNGGKDRRNLKIKKEEEARKGYEANVQKQSIKYTAALAYFDLYKYLLFRNFIGAEITAENKQLSLIESLHKNGIVLKSDVLRTTVKLSQLKLSLSDIEKKIDLTKLRLNIAMGRDHDEKIEIIYKEDFAINGSIDSLHIKYPDYVDMALTQSPEYKIINSDIELSRMNLQQTRAMQLPKISLYSNYNYTYPQISFYPYSTHLWGFGQAGIKLQYSIDNLYKSKHSISLAQIVYTQEKEKETIKKDEISIQIKEAYLQQQQALENIETAEKIRDRNRETVRVIRSSYLNQESLLTDLLEAENALLEAKFNLTTAQANAILSHLRLLAIVGNL